MIKRLALALLAATRLLSAQTAPPEDPVIVGSWINNGSSQRSMIQAIGVRFDRNVAAVLDRDALHVRNLETGALIDLTDATVRFDPRNNTASWIIERDTTALLPDGNYLAWVDLDGFLDEPRRAACAATATPLDDFVFTFHQFCGDTDGDRDVDFRDSCVLRETWLQPVEAERYLSYFDFNLSDLVEESDRALVETTYFTLLPPTPALHLFLRNDTGESFTDHATALYHVGLSGTAIPDEATWRASLNGGGPTDISSLVAGGSAILDEALVDQLHGGPLIPGIHQLTVEAAGEAGVLATATLSFEYLGDVACAPYFVTTPPPGVSLGSVRAAIPLNLSNWTVESYPGSQPLPSWEIAPDGLSVEQTVNARPSALISDQSLLNLRITGTFRVDTSSDDDFMGFIFGYQNSRQFYVFDWKQTTQGFVGGTALRGMGIRRIDGGDREFTERDFWWSHQDRENSTILSHPNDIPWKDFQDYKITLEFTPGLIVVEVREEGALLDRLEVEDDTFTGGKFGFYNYSQSNVVYRGFTAESLDNVYFYDSEAVDPDGTDPTYSLVPTLDGTPPPAGATINAANGTLLWQPTEAGTFPFSIVVTDADGLTDRQDFEVVVTPVDLPPTVTIRKTSSAVFPGEEVGIEAVATDDQQVFRTRLFIDEVEVDPNTANTNIKTNRTFTSIGQVELRAVAIDSADQVSEIVSYLRVLDPATAAPGNPGTGTVAPSGSTDGTATDIRPLVSFQSPLGPTDDPTRLVGTVDPNGGTLARWVVEWAPASRANPANLTDPAVLWQAVAQDTTPRSAAELATLTPADFPDELIVFRLLAENTNGLGRITAITFNPQSTGNTSTAPTTTGGSGPAPTAAFTAPLGPADDSTLVRGTIDANGGTLRGWTLEYAPRTAVDLSSLLDPAVAWTFLARGDTPLTDQPLATLVPADLPDQPLVFRLTATNQNDRATITAIVFNPSATFTAGTTTSGTNPSTGNRPVTRISSPRSPADPIDQLVGSVLANGGTLDRWIVDYATLGSVNPNDLSDPTVAWTELETGTTEIEAAPIAALDAPEFANGRWVVRLRAFNTNGFGSLASTTLDSGDQSVPRVEILSPEGEADIPYITPVRGTISAEGGVIESWSLEIAPSSEVGLNNLNSSSANWTEIGSGTGEVADGEIGTIDPTALRNGSYIVRLRAFNTSGRGFADGRLIYICGEAKLGNFRLEFDDVDVPLAGIPIKIRRIYDTLDANRPCDFGYGWTMALAEADLRETVPDTGSDFFSATPFEVGTRVFVTTPDGKRVGFTFRVRNPRNRFIYTDWDPYFEPDPGVYEQLRIAPRSYERVEVDAAGTVYTPLLPFGYNPDYYQLVTREGRIYDYDQRRGLQKITSPDGQTVTFSSTAITHSGGAQIQLTRDARSRITGITLPDGATLGYRYDVNGDLVETIDALGAATKYTYLARPAHYLEGIANPKDAANGQFTRKVIYENGRVARIEDAAGNVVSRQNFEPGQFSGTRSDALGNVTELVYDAAGNIVQETSPEGAVTMVEYNDPANPGKETAIIDANGNRTELEYDARGNVLVTTDDSGRRTELTYNTMNQPTSLVIRSSTGAELYSVSSEYDARGNLTKITNCNGEEQTATYDALGRPVEITAFDGSVRRLSYGSDSSLRPTSFSTDGGATQEFEYDAAGRPTLQRSSNGETFESTYDAKGQLISVRDAEGNTSSYTYDANGNPIRVTDRTGTTTEMVYDSSNRVIRETKIITDDGDYSDDLVTEITYDAADRITSVTDPLGRTTSYTYDKDNRQTSLTSPGGGVTRFNHDGRGNIIEIVDRLDRRRVFEYDLRDQITREEWYEPGASTPSRVFEVTYTELGQPSRMSDGRSVLNYEYDCGRVVRQHNQGSTNLPAFDFALQYDPVGRVSSVTDQDGANVGFSHNPDGDLVSLVWSGADLPGSSVAYQHDEFGAVSRIDRFADVAGTSMVASTLFDREPFEGAIRSIRHQKPGGQLIDPGSEFVFTSDLEDRVTGQTLQGDDATFTYDSLAQLTGALHSAAELPDETYGYDKIGNRTQSHLGGNTVIDPLGRLAANESFTYTYDADDKLVLETGILTGATRSFSYDHRNRLIALEERSGSGDLVRSSAFTYDPLDRLIARSVDGVVTYTTYFSENAWSDHGSDFGVTARYLYDETIDGQVARWEPGGGVEWVLTDQLRSVRYTVGDDGNTRARIVYDSFGNPYAGEADLLRLRYGFTGREYLGGNLHHYRSRIYNSYTGRFLSNDSLGLSAGDLNLQRYTFNSPLNLIDPTGNINIISTTLAQSISFTLGGVTFTIGVKAVVFNVVAGIVFQPLIDYLCLWLTDETERWNWERARRQAAIGGVGGGLGGAAGSILANLQRGVAITKVVTLTQTHLPWTAGIVGNWTAKISSGTFGAFAGRFGVRLGFNTPLISNSTADKADCDGMVYRLTGGE